MQSTKNHVCSLDQRRFATKAALAQHKRVVHGSQAPQVVAPKRRGRGRGRGGISLNPTALSPAQGNNIVVSGSDRVGEFVVAPNSSQPFSLMVDATLAPRLRSLAQAFQRIKFISLVFNVTAQVSAFTNGGYISGFVMDPDDARISKAILQASTGSVVRKWYESANVVIPKTNELFYTSTGVEPRTRSPGRFWVLVDQSPSTTANVVITAEWKVELSKPAFEDLSSDFSFFLTGGDFRAKKSNYNLQFHKDSGSTGVDDVSGCFPLAVRNSKLEYVFFGVNSFNIEYSEGTGDTGTIQCHFVVYKPSDKRLYCSSDGKNIVSTVWQGDVDEQVSVPDGAYLRHHDADSGNLFGRACPPLNFPPSSSQSSEAVLSVLSSCLLRLETLLGKDSKTSSGRSTPELLG